MFSMEIFDPRGMTKFDPRGMTGTIYVEDHKPLPTNQYQSCGPCDFREDFLFFSHDKNSVEVDIAPASGKITKNVKYRLRALG